ncbi:CD276 antigen-like isoform X2 [Polyodon spathula]|uniref:CD276 antigen-like isoform X2 n=1 Tax=Polyodon spathula TaxID=7913 RepID=UPI001B7F5C0C|nr:CD276 antigen-like isoform X2 [Polyodon spathula]
MEETTEIHRAIMKRTPSSCLFALTLFLTISLAVVVPRSPVTSPPGGDVTLSCSFSYEVGADLSRVVVTWQRPPANDVVHSFYYGRDQLDLQNEAYRNRTQLFPEQLVLGRMRAGTPAGVAFVLQRPVAR